MAFLQLLPFFTILVLLDLPLSFSAKDAYRPLKLLDSSGKIFSSQKGRIAWSDMDSFLKHGGPIPAEEVERSYRPVELNSLFGLSPDSPTMSHENVTVPTNYTGCLTNNPFSQSPDGAEIYWQSCSVDGHERHKSRMEMRILPQAVNDVVDMTPVVSISLKSVCGEGSNAAHWLTPGREGIVRCLPSDSLFFWWLSFPSVLVKTIDNSSHAPPFAVAPSTKHSSVVYLYRQIASAQISKLEVRAFNKTSTDWLTSWRPVRTTIEGVAMGFQHYESAVTDNRFQGDVHYMVAWTKETARIIRIKPCEAVAAEMAPPLSAVLTTNTSANLTLRGRQGQAHLRMAVITETGIHQQTLVFGDRITDDNISGKSQIVNQLSVSEVTETHVADWEALESYNLLSLAYPFPTEGHFVFVKDQLKRGIALLEVKGSPSDVKFPHYWPYPYLEDGETKRGHGLFRAVFPHTLASYQPIRFPDVACRITKPVFTSYSQGQYTVNAVVKTAAGMSERIAATTSSYESDICEIGIILNIPLLSEPIDGEEWPPTSVLEPSVLVAGANVCPSSHVTEWGDVVLTHTRKYVVGLATCLGDIMPTMWAKPIGGGKTATLHMGSLQEAELLDTFRLSPLTTKIIPTEIAVVGTNSEDGTSVVLGFCISRQGSRAVMFQKSCGPYIIDPKESNVDCPLHHVQHFTSTHPSFEEITGICKKPTSNTAYWVNLEITYWSAKLKLRKVLDFTGRIIEHNSVLSFTGKKLLGMSRKGDTYHVTEYRDSLFKFFRVANQLRSIFLTSPISLTRLIFNAENRDVVPRNLTPVGQNEFFWVDRSQHTLWQNYRGGPLEDHIMAKVMDMVSPCYSLGNMVRMIYSGYAYSTAHMGIFSTEEPETFGVMLPALKPDIALLNRLGRHNIDITPSFTVESSVKYGSTTLKGYNPTYSDASRGNPFAFVTSKTGRLTVWTVPGAYAAYASDSKDNMILMKLTFSEKPTGVDIVERPEDEVIDVYIGVDAAVGRIYRLSYDTSSKEYRLPNKRFHNVDSVSLLRHRIRRFSVMPNGDPWPLFLLAPSSSDLPWVHLANVGSQITTTKPVIVPQLPGSYPVRSVQPVNATVVYTDGQEPGVVPLTAVIYEQDPIGAKFEDFRRTVVSFHYDSEDPSYYFHYRVVLPLTADDIDLQYADIRLTVDESVPNEDPTESTTKYKKTPDVAKSKKLAEFTDSGTREAQKPPSDQTSSSGKTSAADHTTSIDKKTARKNERESLKAVE